MPSIRLDEGLSLHCAVDDYLWPWEAPTPVLMIERCGAATAGGQLEQVGR